MPEEKDETLNGASKINYTEAITFVKILLNNYGIRAILRMAQEVLTMQLKESTVPEDRDALRKQLERAEQAAYSIRRRE